MPSYVKAWSMLRKKKHIFFQLQKVSLSGDYQAVPVVPFSHFRSLPHSHNFSPLPLRIHSALSDLFILHGSSHRHLLSHNSAPKFRQYIETLHRGPNSTFLPFLGNKAQRLAEAILVWCLLFKLPPRLSEGHSEYTKWHDLKSVFTAVAVERRTPPDDT